MVNDPSRGLLGRWPRDLPQAGRAIALATLAVLGCQADATSGPAPTLPRVPAREVVVRTASFAFHLGAAVDATWPDKAEETRVALGARLPTLLEEEDVTVPILARQLGVTWPAEALDFDVVLTDAARGPCDAKIARLLEVGGGEGRAFFACALERGLGRLANDSALYRGLTAEAPRAEDRAAVDERYACIVAYAVAAVMVARAADAREARNSEAHLGDRCAPAALDWLGRTWVERVRGELTAEAFGVRASRELPPRAL